MMSALNAKAHRARTKASDTTGEGNTGTPDLSQRPVARQTPVSHDDLADRLDMSALRDSLTPSQSIPTPPDPDEMPEPPSRPDIPEPPNRPDIPEPPQPDPIPSAPAPGPDVPAEPRPTTSTQPRFATLETGLFPAGSSFASPSEPEPATPAETGAGLRAEFGPAASAETEAGLSSDYGPITPAEPDESPLGAGRSRLMAAFDALTGPVPSQPASDSSSEQDPSGEKFTFRTEFDNGDGLPSRKPLTSWAELESAAVVDSPADELFGKPVDTSSRSSLSDAFGGEPREQTGEQPAPSPTTPAASPTTSSTSATPAASPDTSTTSSTTSAAFPARPASITTSDELRAALWGANESPATFGERSPAGGSRAAEAAPEGAATTPGPSGAEADPVGAEVRPSGDGREPSGASVGLDAAPTYDEPIGPQPRPAGPRRRGERSATTIASLLTEALAAYQSSTDEQDEQPPAPERYDSFAGDPVINPGRHRSLE
jgi:hypothetical protein